jgi:hypothetical protein
MKASRLQSFPAINVTQQIAGAAEKRIGIVFFPAFFTYSVGSTDLLAPATGPAIVVRPAQRPVVFLVETHGDCVQKPWFVRVENGTPLFVQFMEIYDR